ncbi:hypothetical protein CAPTEDRAFT_197701 [Capitella teleta]|uniref:L-Fucosyltransferase n=1 Tax=Capitella teleta TaxID=283909 RepID=R7VHG0_CAPTE|nr:hypothetical protein CAPTEDRAFT_197701 [Capitella teleta]|eukprot:ELU18059.1 hypothetical protein CAPTEDRAFT_197701 [Capitella teleta]
MPSPVNLQSVFFIAGIWMTNMIYFMLSWSNSHQSVARDWIYEVTDYSFAIQLHQNNSERTLTFSPNGRLGNRMFQYASLVGIASRSHGNPAVATSDFLSECFLISTNIKKNLCARGNDKHPADLHFDRWAFHLGANVTCLTSLMQSWRYFGHVSDRIRDIYSFRDRHKQTAQQWMNTLNLTSTVVSVQIRRTDFVNQYTNLINPITVKYINTAMHMYRRVFGKTVAFLVVSDDIQWCKQYINTTAFTTVYFSENHSPCVDLAVQASAHHSIITSGSSFGFWGAFLANGHCTYFPGWLRTGSWYNLDMNEADYYLPHWTPVPRT